MPTIKGNDKKEKKPRSLAQLEATARLVKLNKERAVLRAEGKLPPVQRKKKTKTIIQELEKAVETETPVETVKPVKKKVVKRKPKPEPEPEPEPEMSDCECDAEVSSQSSLSDDEYYSYHCDDGGAEGVEDVYTDPPPMTLDAEPEPEPEPEPVKIIIKPKRKRRVYK